MIRNYFKIAWRNLVRNKIYSVVNLVGLVTSLLVILLVATLVIDDLSYDRQWKNSNELYRINSIQEDKSGNFLNGTGVSINGLGKAITQHFPEIKGHTTLMHGYLDFLLNTQMPIKLSTLSTDTNFFNLFDIPVLLGNPKEMVANSDNLVITQSYYNKYFKSQDIIGKTVYAHPRASEPKAYTIIAVIKDLPQNTVLRADALLISKKFDTELSPNGTGSLFGQFILVRKDVNMHTLTNKVNAWYQNFLTQDRGVRDRFEFQALNEIYLHSDFFWLGDVSKNMRDVYILIGIALLILLLACINFINLSFSQAIKRTIEIGIRKTFGAEKNQLLLQGLTESWLFFALSFALAFSLYLSLIPAFERYIENGLTRTFLDPVLFFCLVSIWFILSICCGLAPTLALVKTKASNALKKKIEFLRLPLNTSLTKSLIVFQFSTAFIVIVSMFVIQRQLNFMFHKDLGYNPKNLVELGYMNWDHRGSAFKQALLQQPSILSATRSQWAPVGGTLLSTQSEDPEDPTKMLNITTLTADFDFYKTLGLRIKKGRFLHPSFAVDDLANAKNPIGTSHLSSALITETTAKKFHINQLGDNTQMRDIIPVGIIQDFHISNLKQPLGPTIVLAKENLETGSMLARIEEGKEEEALRSIQQLWKKFYPNYDLRIDWSDEKLKKQYQKESDQHQQLLFFSFLSIILAVLGVLGLTSYTIEQKLKEISIRKVMGASVHSILLLLSSNFVKLNVIAVTIASPISYWIMGKWLEDFAYRVDIPWWLFLLISLLMIAILMVTISAQTIKAASANPVDSLRNE